MNRRELLKRAGLVAATGACAGCPVPDTDSNETDPRTETATETGTEARSPPAETQSPEPRIPSSYEDRFDWIVDVTEAGADPTGTQSVTPVLERVGDDDTLLYFPEGTYLMETAWENRSFENVGILGNDAVVKPPDGFQGYLFAFGRPGEARDLLVEGMEFDVTAPETGARVIEGRVDDGLEVRNVSVAGVQDIDYASTRFDVTTEDGTGVVERLSLPDGGRTGSLAIGSYVGDQSVGRLDYVDCEMRGFPNNGLYGSSSQGPLHVVGGFYANNDISSVRVGNDAVVRDVRVRCDESPNEYENMRGIRLRNGATARVENCTVEFVDVNYSDGAIVLAPWMEGATIVDTSVTVHADGVPAVRAKSTTEDTDSGQFTCRNLTVDGRAANYRTIEVSDRNNCVFENLTVRQTGDDRNGLFLQRSTENELRDSLIDVTGDPIVLQQANVQRVNSKVLENGPFDARD